MKVKKSQTCRLCSESKLTDLLDLGEQCLTGVFPKTLDAALTKGPLQLMLCDTCGLIQLRHSYDINEMYGKEYGYRSGLNRSMVDHLRTKVEKLHELCSVENGDLILDIGSNDGTLLSFYPPGRATLCGMDPSSEQFRSYYREDIKLVMDFFSAKRFRQEHGDDAKAKIITSIAMFYDLEQPFEFVRQIKEILHPQGIWHLEQSYLPLMLESNAYDTICHEHLEYYGLRQIKWLTDRAGLEILDVDLNGTNGGSFAITVSHVGAGFPCNEKAIAALLESEQKAGLDKPETYALFADAISIHKTELLRLLEDIREQGKTVLGYGASTKGNVILQYCGFTPDMLPAIAEVNASKFGAYTPGTGIPIICEAEARARRPDYFLVFPWHFRDAIVAREREFLAGGGKLIFPLPRIEIVSR